MIPRTPGPGPPSAPNGLAVSVISLASVLVRAIPTVTGTLNPFDELCHGSTQRNLARPSRGAAVASKKNSSMRVILDLRRKILDHLAASAARAPRTSGSLA